jgi:sugar lactone lactonase YvrE
MPDVSRSRRLAPALIVVLVLFLLPTSVHAAVPTVSSISPINGSLGQTVVVTLTGTGLSAGGAFVSVSGNGIGVTNVMVNSDTSMTATFTIVPLTATGGRSVSVTTTGGTSATVNFQVLAAPTLTSITTVSPTNTLTIGTAYGLTVAGTNFAATTVSVTGTSINISGSGITVDPPAASNNTASRTFTVRVASNASAGPRAVSVSTSAGTTASININVSTNVAPGYLVSTAAGQDLITENGTPTAQPLQALNDIARDSNGNLYIAMSSANKVYKITSDLQHISTFAGTGALGSAGDGLQATAAQLTSPLAVIADATNNIYIAEGAEIRRVAPDGTISTFAGRPGLSFSGNNGKALYTQFENPTGFGIDSSSNLYVVDDNSELIWKITPAGVITTVAGNGMYGFTADGALATQASLGLDQTTKIAIDSAGNIYFPDTDNGKIRMVAAGTGILSTIASGLSSPTAVALDSSNPNQLKLLVIDEGRSLIQEIIGTTTISSGVPVTVAGNANGFIFNGDGPATSINLSNPLSGALDGSGNLYFVDTLSNRIRLFSPSAMPSPTVTTVAGNSGVFSGDGGPAASAQFYLPQSIAIDPADNLFITDSANVRVRKVSGMTVTTIAGTGGLSLTVSPDGGPATSATLGIPWAVATTTSGVVYIAASTTLFQGTDSRIWKVGLDNNITTVAGGSTSGYNGDNVAATAAQLNGPLGVVVDQNTGNIYIADTCNFRVRRVNVSTGIITTIAGNGTQGYSGDGGPASSAELGSPRQLALDSSGNLYITDRGSSDNRCNGNVQGLSQRVWKVTPGGTISTVSTLSGKGVAVNGSSLFVAGPSTIAQIFPDGGGGVIAGSASGYNGLSGDNGPAAAGLISADGLAVNSHGVVFFVDQTDNVVRSLTPQTPPVLTAFPFGISVRGGGTPSFTTSIGVGTWGSSTAMWNATISGAPWLSISPSSGTGTSFGTVTATYNPSLVTPACSTGPCFYNGSITFMSTPGAANGSFTVPVTLTVLPENISPAPTSLQAFGFAGGFIPSQTVTVGNSGIGGSFNFTTMPNSPWLSVAPLSPALGNSATSPFVTVSYNTMGLATGTYNGGFTISSTDPVANSFVTIPVTLILNAANTAPAPGLSSVSPVNGAQGQTVNVTLTGFNFPTNPSVSVLGGGITVSSVTAVNSATITATFTIDPAATTSVRTVVVTNTATNAQSSLLAFTVLGAPTLTSISPTFGNPGTTVSAVLTGTNLVNSGLTVFLSGTGVTPNVVSSTNTTSRTVLLTIASNAPTGPQSLTVSTAAGTSSAVTFAVAPDFGSGYQISTVAGLDVVAENQTATNQPLPFFFDVARDSNGNLYIASQNANKVYKVSGGNISTFAGTGTPGPGGDGGPATSAQLNQPRAVVVDANNNVYIADAGNHRVRQVSAADGTIKIVAGTGAAGFSGDGASAKFAQLNAPSGLGIDSAGAIYINDLNNHRIRKADPNTGIITTVAGNGVAGYNGDGGQAILARLNLDSQTTKLAIDGAGNLYLPDALNNRVRMVAANGTISTFAGTALAGFSGDNGQANAAMLNTPRAVAFDNNGNLYISDSNNNRIRRVTSAGGISTVAGNGFYGFNGDGTATAQQLAAPIGLATGSSANVYFADSGSNRLREVSGGALSTLAGNSGVFGGDGGSASLAPLYQPSGVALSPPTGALLIADSRDYRGRFVVLQAIPNFVVGDIYTGAGNGSAGVSGDGGPSTSAPIGFVNDVFADNAGNVFLSGTNLIRIITPDGFINTFAGQKNTFGAGIAGYNGDSISATSAQLNNPQGMTMDAAGNLYIADSNNQRVRMVTNTWSYNSTTHVLTPGTITTVAGNGSAGPGGDGASATSAQLNNPRRLAFDANADTYGSGKLYIADNNNSKIRVVDSGGNINTFSTFGGTAVAYSSGNLYIASGSQIQRWFPDGSFATIAGTGFGISGDNGPALMAALSVSGLAAAADGTIYVADSSDNVVRKLAPVPGGSAVLSASPVGFNLRMSNNSSSTQTIPITLVPDVALNWTAAANVTTPAGSEWLSISGPSSGTGSFPLSVLVNASGLATGVYNGSVTITSASPPAVNGSITIPFTLTVLPSILSTSVASFAPVATACNSSCSNFSSPNFTVTNSGSGINFAFTAAAAVVSPPGGNWLSVAPAGSTTGSGTNFSATYNVTGLPPGVYTGNIILTGAASNSPLELPVTLTINPSGGPTLTSITPSSGSPGQTVNVILTGTNFSPSVTNTVAIGGSGVTISNVVFLSGTSLFATLSISNSATLGADNVTVNNGQGTSPAAAFTVATKKRTGQIISQ